jgi:hypothetical protein
MPSAMTVARYLGGLVRSQVEYLPGGAVAVQLRQLRAPALGAVLDLDSTVFARNGH